MIYSDFNIYKYMMDHVSYIYDNFKRPVNSLRLQVNAICNYNCMFCHMEGTDRNLSYMTPDEIERVVRVAASFGVSRIKITGGEPLLRHDIIDIIKRIKRHVDDISMTTNGVMLHKLAYELKDAGLKRINISMHALNDNDYLKITGNTRNFRPEVIDGIKSAHLAGLEPVKVNFVVLKGINDDKINDMMDFCLENDAVLQLIEYEAPRNMENSYEYIKYHVDLRNINDDLMKKSIEYKKNTLHNRPVYSIPWKDGMVRVEVVMPMHNSDFCMHCTRLRVTADGKFKTCLLRDNDYFDIKSFDDDYLRDLYIKAVKNRIPYWR